MFSRIRAWNNKRKFRNALEDYFYAKKEFYEWRDRMPTDHLGRTKVLEKSREAMHKTWAYLESEILYRDLGLEKRLEGYTRTYFTFEGEAYVLSHNRKTAIHKRIFKDRRAERAYG